MNAAPVAGGTPPEASAAAARPADAGSAEAGARERRGDDRAPPAPPEPALALRFHQLLADEPVAAELPSGHAEPATAEPALPRRTTLMPSTSDERHEGHHDEPPPQPDAAPPLPSPMALFTRLAETDAPRAPEAPPPPADWLQRIEALAVAGGDAGERRVRLTLADTLLPETEVEVGEAAGELQVHFFCRRQSGREALSLQAPLLAQALADRLQREVRVSVGGLQRDGDERTHSLARPEVAP